MDEMNAIEILVEKTEENQTRKILELMHECKAKGENLSEAIEKVKDLLNK